MEEKVRQAIRDELQRQAAESSELRVTEDGRRLVVNGPVDVETLAFTIMGALAGGP